MQRYKEFISLTNFSDGKCNLGALFNDFVPKLTVETHILREFRSYLMKDVYLCGVIADFVSPFLAQMNQSNP